MSCDEEFANDGDSAHFSAVCGFVCGTHQWPFPSEDQSALADLTRVGELITFCTSSNLNSLVSMRLSDHTGCCLYTQSKPFGSFCGIIKIMVLGERIAWSRNHSVGRFLTTD